MIDSVRVYLPAKGDGEQNYIQCRIAYYRNSKAIVVSVKPVKLADQMVTEGFFGSIGGRKLHYEDLGRFSQKRFDVAVKRMEDELHKDKAGKVWDMLQAVLTENGMLLTGEKFSVSIG